MARLLRGWKFRFSKKYTFSLIACILFFAAIIPFQHLGWDQPYLLIGLVITQACVLVMSVAFVTGQAKIDLNARASYGEDNRDVK